MATVPVKSFANYRVRVFTWVLASGETGDPISMPYYDDNSLQVYGNFGGGTLGWLGASDPTNPHFTNLRDANTGIVIALTIEDIVQVLAGSFLYEPKLVGGGGASLTVVAKFKR